MKEEMHRCIHAECMVLPFLLQKFQKEWLQSLCRHLCHMGASLSSHSKQGRRKHHKVGGTLVSRSTFRMKTAPKKIFTEMLETGAGKEK